MNEMDGVAISVYKFNKQGSKILFKTKKDLIEAEITKARVSGNKYCVKHIDINLQISKLRTWADVDNLSISSQRKKIIKKWN